MTAEEIAAGLTANERKIMLRSHPTVFMDRWKCKGRFKSLRALGLTVAAWRGGDLLTPLGEQVRAILESNHDRA